MLREVLSEATRQVMKARCQETMSLAGARLEMVERELARREMSPDDLMECLQVLRAWRAGRT